MGRINDGIDAAFAELESKGIVALQNAGFTLADGWVSVGEASRRKSPKPRGAVFYHEQDRARGIAGEGLRLAFGVLGSDDAAKIVVIGREVCDTLRRYGVETEWDGTADARIVIPPFEWAKAGDDQAPLELRMAAAEGGDLEAVRRTRVQDLDHCDRFGRTLLTVATENDHPEIVASLLDAGAKPEAHRPEALFIRYLPEGAALVPRGTNFSLLHIAAWHGAAGVARLLLDRGFAVDARDLYGGTPLLEAAMHDKIETIELLLAAKADPNAFDVIGKAPLNHASEMATIRRLLDAGASPDGGPLLGLPHRPEAGDFRWMRPFERFETAGQTEIAELLRSRGAKTDSFEASNPQAPEPHVVAKAARLPEPKAPPAPSAPVPAAAGDTVTHATFGRGRVIAVKGDKLEVEFESAGRKLLVARVLTVDRG